MVAKPFAEGDLALLIDPKDRRYLVRLVKGRSFHTHLGAVPHDEIIGQEDGARVHSQRGHELTALRPTYAEYVLKMGRGAQVVYPKDTAAMLMAADIHPGARVVEAGAGSGALTIALLRAVGPSGSVTTYELREDWAAQAAKNVREFLGETPNFTLNLGDIYGPIPERDVDRVVLDVPEPWQAINTVGESLRQGGLFVAYLPTVLQIHRLYQELAADGRFDFVEAFEVIQRPWHLAPTSARPVHRMVGHTGFMVKAVRCAPRKARAISDQASLDQAPAAEGEPVPAIGNEEALAGGAGPG
jgi:tRNA (adenine57-N1/adenine58-N1)-methyltransferase